LNGYLRERQIDHLFLAGLAFDFCVKWSALDGLKEGFQCTVVEDAVKGIDMDDSVAKAWDEMQKAGTNRIRSDELV
jgi:nicotinamidase/pyrazinamidase